MRVLVIDDLELKVRNIKESFKGEEVLVEICWLDGLLHILDKSPDIVVLDMNFPRYSDCESNVEDGIGISILMEMQRKEVVIPVIVYSTDKRDYSKYTNVIGVIQKDLQYSIKEDINEILVKAKLR